MKKVFALLLIAANVFALDGRDALDGKDSSQEAAKPIASTTPADNVPFFADKSALSQIIDSEEFKEKLNSLHKATEQQWPQITKDVQSKFSKEIDRYNLSAVFGLQGNNLKILGANVAEIEASIKNLSITADLYYRLELRPSYRQGKQMRKDIYVIGLKGGSTVSAGAEIRITFFREFDSKADALTNFRPYGFNRIPRTADDVLKKVEIQDGVRIEGMANLEISKAFSDLMGSTNLSAILGYDLFEGVVMLDIYRYTESEVRTRFMSTLNRGTVKGEVGLNWLSNFRVPRILPRWIKEIFEFNFNINISKTFNFFRQYPIETHVADYYFRFNAPAARAVSISAACRIAPQEGQANEQAVLTAESAFNEIVKNAWDGKFVKLFNMEDEQLATALNQNTSQAEMLACLDRELPNYKKRVQHLFKGRMSADIFSLDFGPKISQLIRSKAVQGNSEIFVASLEKGQEFKYYTLLNTFSRSEQDHFFGRWETEYISDFDALFMSDKNKNIKTFLDFVKRIQYRDKSMSKSDLKEIYNTLNRSIPKGIEDREKILALIPNVEQSGALISLVYTLSAQVLLDIEAMGTGELYNRLDDFIENHPQRRFMTLPPQYQEGFGPNLTDFIGDIFIQLSRFSRANENPMERFLALKKLMNNQVFTEFIFVELFPSFLTSTTVKNAMSVTLSVSSKETAYTQDTVGMNQYSSVYGAVLLLRSVLNDRSLDLRLESVNGVDGGMAVTNPINMGGFRAF